MRSDRPGVFDDLLAPVRGAWSDPFDPRNACILQGCMYAIHQVVKCLSTGRLMRGKQLMQQVRLRPLALILEQLKFF